MNSYSVVAQATDSAGNLGTSPTVTFTYTHRRALSPLRLEPLDPHGVNPAAAGPLALAGRGDVLLAGPGASPIGPHRARCRGDLARPRAADALGAAVGPIAQGTTRIGK